MKLWFNLMSRDIDAQCLFYRTVFGLPEAEAARSPIYRALETADFQLGFNDGRAAYGLLGLDGRQAPHTTAPRPTVAYATFMLPTPSAVDEAVQAVRIHGGQVLKAPFATYYGQWQAVLADPEDNVFRIATDSMPEGVSAPQLTT